MIKDIKDIKELSPEAQEAFRDYLDEAHGVQTGVKFTMELGITDAHTPKHLRTGIDCRAADQAALAGLLIERGIFTQEEYIFALRDAMRAERKRYEEELTKALKKQVSLR